jgi:hypothetical protein
MVEIAIPTKLKSLISAASSDPVVIVTNLKTFEIMQRIAAPGDYRKFIEIN